MDVPAFAPLVELLLVRDVVIADLKLVKVAIILIHVSVMVHPLPPLLLHEKLVSFIILDLADLFGGTWLVHKLPHLVYADPGRIIGHLTNR